MIVPSLFCENPKLFIPDPLIFQAEGELHSDFGRNELPATLSEGFTTQAVQIQNTFKTQLKNINGDTNGF